MSAKDKSLELRWYRAKNASLDGRFYIVRRMIMDYKDTLLMNKSNFEMRGNLNQKEPVLVKKWEEEKIYENMNLNRKDAKEFVLHDGPPYANGDMHCGHMLHRISGKNVKNMP